MKFNTDEFVSDLVRGYLRTLRKYGPHAVVGEFEHNGVPFFWGSCKEYGFPPLGSFVLEYWPESHPHLKGNLRVWLAVDSERKRRLVRGRSLWFSEVDPQTVPLKGMA